jgi:superfamily II DNA or RNA helicase
VEIPAVIDNHVRVDGNYLGADLTEQILDELTLLNPAWVEASKRNGRVNGDISKHIILADLDGDTLVMPRGYAYEFKLLLREHGHTVKWIDRRKWKRGPAFGVQKFGYRPHQVVAVRRMRHHQQGIYEAPTGSGKTVAVCGLIWELRPAKAIILVDKIELIHQWRRELLRHTGCPESMIGQIGQGKWVERRITIATVQSLRKALREGRLDQFWFDQWDFMDLDECHHVTADTIMDLVSLFPARMRLGNSATPDRQDEKFDIALDVIGDVVHSEAEEELRAAGFITAPKVYRIVTDFNFPYHRDHRSGPKGQCEIEGCKISRQHSHRNNYHKLRAALVADPARNALVAAAILEQIRQGRHIHLVISDEVGHLEHLMTWYGRGAKRMRLALPPTYLLTGKTPKARRAKIIDDVNSLDDAVLFSTVAKEGLDIPMIDRIYLPFPGSQPAATEQKIGRGTRARSGKGETLIFDFCDAKLKVLRRQFKNRRTKVYDKLGLEVIL